MTKSASNFIGNVPEHYDAGLGPVIFKPYAEDMARRAAALAPDRVLELAAGTGIVSRALKDAFGLKTRLTVSDLNPPMLELAQTKFDKSEGVEFIPADAMNLEFPENRFDLIVCQFGVMFFPDKVQAFKQARRVLKPGGDYLFSVWGSLDDNPFSKETHALMSEVFPDNPPSFYKVPFSYANKEDVLADLEAAGFNDVVHEDVAITGEVADWSAFAHGLVYGNPIIEEIQDRGVNPDDIVEAIKERFIAKWGAAPAAMPRNATVFRSRTR